jgi:uncharacterized integral membrane protein (TIGR00698 family)
MTRPEEREAVLNRPANSYDLAPAECGTHSMFSTALFAAVLIYSSTPWSSPGLALLLGLFFGLSNLNPSISLTARSSRWMLKASVVGLGFGMDIHAVFRTGQASLLYTGCGITLGVLLGLILGRLLSVPANAAFLIAVGTAICGGSAIAAVAPIVGADDEETAVSLSTVFLLNAAALFAFPAIAGTLRLSQAQFGLWAAMAIHDTSSVVGAGLRYGPTALAIATTVKLVRALWILPVTAVTAIVLRARGRAGLPWFIALFIVAAWIRSISPGADPVWKLCATLARGALAGTLFLIGSSLSIPALRQVGWRIFVQGAVLWLIVATVSLTLIQRGWIHL